jgi:hypothetical protein
MPTTVLMLAIFIVLSAVPFWLLRGKLPPFRFSSLTAFALMTIVGLTIVVALQWREIGPLRAEVMQMRRELGRLTIDDPGRAQAIAVHQPDVNRWRWRIYLPPGGQYRFHEFGGMLPPRGKLDNRQWFDAMQQAQYGISSGAFSSDALQGEFTLDASLTLVGDRWRWKTHPGGGESRYTFTDNWPGDVGRIETSDVWENVQRVYDSGEPILLLYLSQSDKTTNASGATSHSPPKGAAEGIALWLEQTPP